MFQFYDYSRFYLGLVFFLRYPALPGNCAAVIADDGDDDDGRHISTVPRGSLFAGFVRPFFFFFILGIVLNRV